MMYCVGHACGLILVMCVGPAALVYGPLVRHEVASVKQEPLLPSGVLAVASRRQRG